MSADFREAPLLNDAIREITPPDAQRWLDEHDDGPVPYDPLRFEPGDEFTRGRERHQLWVAYRQPYTELVLEEIRAGRLVAIGIRTSNEAAGYVPIPAELWGRFTVIDTWGSRAWKSGVRYEEIRLDSPPRQSEVASRLLVEIDDENSVLYVNGHSLRVPGTTQWLVVKQVAEAGGKKLRESRVLQGANSQSGNLNRLFKGARRTSVQRFLRWEGGYVWLIDPSSSQPPPK